VQITQDGLSTDDTIATSDRGWAEETALDVEMASAACPKCSILLVEANSASFRDLEAAVMQASKFAGVVSISNSYGGPDFAERSNSAYLTAAKAGIAVTAASGDSGYGASAPASFASVIAVGGTSLAVDGAGRWLNETAWSMAGSGCSQLNRMAIWQNYSESKCRGKAIDDVASVADPSTGVTVSFEGSWYTFGSTSASSPFIAGLYALRPNFKSANAGFASAALFTLANRTALHDVASGSNGTCPQRNWCQSGFDWDGPTGWGTPNGTDAF
jgi:subtilase family serine protease